MRLVALRRQNKAGETGLVGERLAAGTAARARGAAPVAARAAAGGGAAGQRPPRRAARGLAAAAWESFADLQQNPAKLQIFGRLVLGCIETNFCK